MKQNCEYCFELLKDCVCTWTKCAECGKRIPESHASEYRGRIWCEEEHDFDEQVAKRDYQRAEVMRVAEHAVNSQRKGEFVNKSKQAGGYKGKLADDGLPIMKIKEPLILKEYEGRE